ncbi:hypothetical protein SORBI_3001G087500 [Sorghum bicolor]|uniref:Uncharacterized protein n=1 Tax=Sorghum bicolor TaxID=4558 RepID=A0A1B6QHZ8_SORBI|nr:hypothetical protein SORBI_3001G087500 [Sorghum bicolor]
MAAAGRAPRCASAPTGPLRLLRCQRRRQLGPTSWRTKRIRVERRIFGHFYWVTHMSVNGKNQTEGGHNSMKGKKNI